MNETEMAALFADSSNVLTRSYPAKWEAAQPGEILIGEYLGAEKWTHGAIAGTSYRLKLLNASANVVLTVGGSKHAKDVPATSGLEIALSGKMLDVLASVAPGTKIAVRYDGLSEYSDEDRKRLADGKQPLKARTKMFTVVRVAGL